MLCVNKKLEAKVRMTKILQINTVYQKGSVGRIMAELYNAAEKSGYESYMAFSRDDVPKGIRGYRIGNTADLAVHVLDGVLFGRGGFASTGETRKFLNWIDEVQPDLIHLHNIHGFYLQVELLFDYIKKKNIPVIWTLHDCWPITGHCAYFDYVGCNKWKTKCQQCPQHLQSYPYSVIDNSKKNYEQKRKAFTNVKNLTIVTPSQWLADIVKKSFLQEYQVQTIPNGINLSQFRVLENINRKENEKVVLGVANVWDRRKGLKYFLQLAEMLPGDYLIYLVGVNRKQEKMILQKKFQNIVPIMHTDSVEELVELYNRAVVYVNPTMEDNFPTTNLEAMACGTPVITFRTGGSPELIDESLPCAQQCGAVVEKGDINNLYNQIIRLSNISDSVMTDRCRRHAMSYSWQERFAQYMELYRHVCYNTRIKENFEEERT